MSEDMKAAARRWAHEYMLCNFEIPEHAQDDEYMAAKYITQCLAPPTMEDLPWDRDRHFLAGATDGEYDYVMISPYRHDEESFLEIATIDCGSSNLMMIDAHSLIPNGKKYELHEAGATVSSNENVGDDQKEHPETLRTAEDYKDAPVGTVVAHNGCFPYVKQGRDVWTDTFDDKFSDDLLSGIPRQVLRRGWGE